MINKVREALEKASKDELIDIIEERMYLDPVFRKTLEHRFSAFENNVESQIKAYQKQVKDEVEERYPDTTVIRSAGFALKRNMDSWSTYDYCRGHLTIIRSLDDALCNGAGMEDDTDYEISMDLEDAAECIKERISREQLSEEENGKIRALIEGELNRPLGVYGKDIYSNMLQKLATPL